MKGKIMSQKQQLIGNLMIGVGSTIVLGIVIAQQNEIEKLKGELRGTERSIELYKMTLKRMASKMRGEDIIDTFKGLGEDIAFLNTIKDL